MKKQMTKCMAVLLSATLTVMSASPVVATEAVPEAVITEEISADEAGEIPAENTADTEITAETATDTEAPAETTDSESKTIVSENSVSANDADPFPNETSGQDSNETFELIDEEMECETASSEEVEEEWIPVTEDAFTKTSTLKGIQGNAGAGEHYFMNCLLQTGFQTDSKSGKEERGYTAHEYQGKTYYFQIPTGVDYGTIKSLNAEGKTVSIEFLLQYDTTKTRLIDPDARTAGFAYYAPNMTTDSVRKEYEAFFDFLAKEFSRQDCHIDNWILGNEVNMGNSAIGYHYAGADKSKWVSKYADYFNVVYGAVRTYTSATRVSICVDHSWNDSDEGRGISVKDFLKKFSQKVGKSKDWSISYHCYPAVLFETKLWEASAFAGVKLNKNSSNARFVDGANLKVMTNYVKKNYGSNHRIMLTEQGFSNYQGSKAQAAAFVYTYYAAKFDPMVDCMIIRTNNDGDKLNFTPGSLMVKCYNKIDSGKASDVKWIDKKILPIIGVKNWSSIVPGYNGTVLSANTEKITAYVSNLYLYGLGREATQAEIENLVSSIKKGKTTAAAAAKKVILSSAATSMYASNEDYIKAAYKALYGKDASASTVSKYAKLLKKKHTRKYIVKKMVEDKKFKKICTAAGMEVGKIKAKK